MKKNENRLFPDSESAPEISIRSTFSRNPVFIDGLPRSGKLVIVMLVSSFERAEHIQARPMLDSIFFMYGMGLMGKDAAVELLRREVDLYLYFSLMGRHINTNIHDWSGVMNSRDPEMYLKRLTERESPENFLAIMQRMKQEPPILPFLTHDVFCDHDIFLESFPDSRFIISLRHPVELVFTWHLRKTGERPGNDPRFFRQTLRGKTEPVPWYAWDWAEEYENAAPLDRCIKSIYVLNKRYYEKLDTLPKQWEKKVLAVPFEQLCTDTDEWTKRLTDFLATSTTGFTRQVYFKQDVPRKLDQAQFANKYRAIRENCRKEMWDLFIEDCERYEQRYETGFSIRNVSAKGSGKAHSGNGHADFSKYFTPPERSYGSYKLNNKDTK